MMFDNYVETVGKRFTAYLDEIAAYFNFEHGPEFEIAICKTLRRALPSKYGVCRGFLVNADGQTVGDDIIIYNHERFPSLRMIDNEEFTQRESIPIEAAYAYIEAKNSLVLSGKEETFDVAVEKVRSAKSLVANREDIDVTKAIDPTIVMTHLVPHCRQHWPPIMNPFFTAIISRHVRKSKGATPLVGADVATELAAHQVPDDHPPDLIVAGDDIVGLPFVKDETSKTETYYSPFSIDDSHILLKESPKLAFAIGFCSLLLALENIRLGVMPWKEIISDALGIQMRT